ncbi:MAG: adenylosuccinate synthase [Bacteroidetes bacterium]|jgi:adenylosuccinate synthase|nr:adenylosuccinate synthase [Bacteroidota bacterium]
MVDVLLGLQWGDEGKGKIADYLTPKYKVVARFQGGPNAGHSLEFNGQKHVLNTIPSGIFHEGCINIIGNGVVIDPVRFMEEIDRTAAAGANVKENLRISYKAHIIMPTHKILDAASEWSKGDKKIGSTLRGIGPTYREKIGRGGLRIGELFAPNFEQNYHEKKLRSLQVVEQFGFTDFDLDAMEEEFFTAVERLRKYQFVNSEYLVNEHITNGDKILAEGAQGSMLDIDFGSYPFVTSSNTTVGGVSTGLGIAPKHINKVKGIFKAYCTRVGSGPFPSELNDEMGEHIRTVGNEFGATTGRPRRTGWLDIVALKYAIMLSGVDELCMMKADCLSGIDEVMVGASYKGDLIETKEVPFDLNADNFKSVYEAHPGWQEDITQCTTHEELPQSFKNYISSIEQQINVPISIISVGPGRNQTIIK